jgi:hypothetical protein
MDVMNWLLLQLTAITMSDNNTSDGLLKKSLHIVNVVTDCGTRERPAVVFTP